MVFVPSDRYLWDFWFAPRADPTAPYHLFFLQAPRGLPDPEDRHGVATIGHAVSADLVHWRERPPALGPGSAGAWDDRAIWTGSIVAHRGRYYWFYTGTNQRDRVQRIGLATSADLEQWQRWPANPLLEADPRWYETGAAGDRGEEACRDPWVVAAPDGTGWLLFFTARGRTGPSDARGVVGLAVSRDLLHWEPRPPAVAPGVFYHLEVPQVIRLAGRFYLLFCTVHHAAGGVAWIGTHYLIGEAVTGPYRLPPGAPLLADRAGTYYAGRIVADPTGAPVFLAWRHWDARGRFLGGLSNPAPVVVHADGRLTVEATALWPSPS